MRELNRLGITSAIDAGGGFQNYPDDYKVIEELAEKGELTLRIAYNLFTQHPKGELADFSQWITMTSPGKGDDFYRLNGAGEMLVFSAADFEDFLEPRPDLPPMMEEEALPGGPPPRGETLAFPPPRHLRRVDLALPRRLRIGQP